MEEKEWIFLFDKEKLLSLDEKLRALRQKKAITFDETEVKKQPYCNALTSIARLLSAREVCGCLHVKEDKLFLFTNKENENSTFRQEVAQLIVQLVKGDFKQGNKLSLYKRCFNEVIKATTKRYEIELSEIESFRKYVLNKKDWEAISLQEIGRLTQDIEQFLKDNIENIIVRQACIKVLIHLDDLNKICNVLSESCYETFRAVIQEQSHIDCYKNVEKLHCEVAAIQRDSRETDLETAVYQISERVANKHFTISKFCCLLCQLIFQTLQECHPNKESINFSYLGNTCILFPHYQIPLVKKSVFSERVANQLNAKLQMLIEKMDAKNYTSNALSIIENSEVITQYSPTAIEQNKREQDALRYLKR